MAGSETRNISFTDSEKFRCLEDLQKETVDLYLTYCGREHCEPSYRYGPNRRVSYVLHLVQEGRGTLEMDGRRYEIGREDAFLIPAGVEAWYEADAKDPWAYSWIGFSGLTAAECMTNAGFSRKNPVRRVGCPEELNRCIGQMLELHRNSCCDTLRRNGLLLLALSALIEDYQAHSGGEKLEEQSRSAAVYVKHAMEYMTGHYGERVRIGELADYIGVNRSYLTSSFKKLVGVSPQEYLLNLRMEKAKMLLRTELPVGSVASIVGYGDPLAFSRVFKRCCGVSPRHYREEKKELLLFDKKGEHVSRQI